MPLTGDELQRLESIEHLLSECVNMRDHYCDEDNCCIETPKCYEMSGIAALAALRNFLDPPHVSLQVDRLRNEPERIYLELWRRRCQREPAVNRGYGLLEWILAPDCKHPARVTPRDAQVAASVVQWLGTSCGLSFIHEAERLVERARAVRQKFDACAQESRVVGEAQEKGTEPYKWARKFAEWHSVLARSVANCAGKPDSDLWKNVASAARAAVAIAAEVKPLDARPIPGVAQQIAWIVRDDPLTASELAQAFSEIVGVPVSAELMCEYCDDLSQLGVLVRGKRQEGKVIHTTYLKAGTK